MAKHARKKQMSDKLAVVKAKRVSQADVSKFEQKFTREKYSVLGRKKTKDRGGKPLESKARAFRRRSETLGAESAAFHKANRFVDRRLGERAPGVSREAAMLQRLTVERRRRYAREAFNLDESDTAARLTHYGQSLAAVERLEVERDGGRSDDDDDEAPFGAELNFGGNEADGDSSAKSRKQLIDEMIARSKQSKHEKQTQRQEAQSLTDRLDLDWKEALRGNLLSDMFGRNPATQAPGEPAGPPASADGSSSELHSSAHVWSSSTKGPVAGEPTSSDYDTLFRELTFDRRSGPAQDASKSEEQAALDDSRRLAGLEAERLGRMRGNGGPATATERQRPTAHFNPDELECNYEPIGRRRSVGPVAEEPKDSDEEEDENEKSVDELNDFELEFKVSKSRKSDRSKSGVVEDSEKPDVAPSSDEASLRFVYEMPKSYDELKSLLVDRSCQDQTTVLDRLVKCLHPSLKAGNKQKLQKLFLYLLRYFDEISTQTPIDFKLLDQLTVMLFKLKEYGKEYAAKSVKALLKKHRHNYISRSKGSFKLPPPANVVCFLRLVAHLFPVSDFHHPVVTPCVLFLSEILRKIKCRNFRHVSAALLICTIFIEYVKDSKKYSPDLVHFLQNLLSDKKSKRFRVTFSDLTGEIRPLSISGIFDPKSDESDPPRFNAPSSLLCALKLCKRLSRLYSQSPSWLEIFAPIRESLENWNNASDLHPVLKLEIDGFRTDLAEQAVKFSMDRRFLIYSSAHATSGKKNFQFLEPRLEANFNPEKKKFKFDRGPKAETAKLKRQYKREYKGTVRELRRDNEFLARRQMQENAAKDQARREKTKRLMASLMGQEADYKKMKRSKD